MDADDSFYVKFIAAYAPTFFGYIISFLAIVVYVTKVKNILTNCEKKAKAICIVQDYMLSLESIWGLIFRFHNHGRIFYIN